MIYREKGTVEAWQVPQEKDRRKALPAWVADWHPGRIAEEPALILVSLNGGQETTHAMAGNWLVNDGGVLLSVPADAFADRYEPAE